MSTDIYLDDPDANTLVGFKKAVDIFIEHCDDNIRFPFNAEHEIIYGPCGFDDIPEDSEDGKNLQRLGWSYDEQFNCWCYFT